MKTFIYVNSSAERRRNQSEENELRKQCGSPRGLGGGTDEDTLLGSVTAIKGWSLLHGVWTQTPPQVLCVTILVPSYRQEN